MSKNPDFKPVSKPDFEDDRPYNPIRTINQADINTLFTIVQDGINYNKLKKFISERNDTYKLVDKDGRTVIHIILQDGESTISEEQQLGLIKFFINNGVSASAFNKNNETALHLATKQQKASIVEYLTSIGVNANIENNQGMNPIHYAVQGKISKCKPIRKVKKLIPAPKNEKIVSVNFKNLSKSILDVLGQEPFIKYLKHIDQVFQNMDTMFPDEMNEIKNEFKLQVQKEIVENKSNFDSDKLNQIMSNNIKKIVDMMQNKLPTTLKHIQYIKNNLEGWGPTDNIKVLPALNDSPLNIMENYKNNNTKFDDTTPLNTNIQNTMNELNNDEGSLFTYIAKILKIYTYIKRNTYVSCFGIKKENNKFYYNKLFDQENITMDLILTKTPISLILYEYTAKFDSIPVAKLKITDFIRETGELKLNELVDDEDDIEKFYVEIRYPLEAIPSLPGYLTQQRYGMFSDLFMCFIDTTRGVIGNTNKDEDYEVIPYKESVIADYIDYNKFIDNPNVYFELVDASGVNKKPFNLGKIISQDRINKIFKFEKKIGTTINNAQNTYTDRVNKRFFIQCNSFPVIGDLTLNNDLFTYKSLTVMGTELYNPVYPYDKINKIDVKIPRVDKDYAQKLKGKAVPYELTFNTPTIYKINMALKSELLNQIDYLGASDIKERLVNKIKNYDIPFALLWEQLPELQNPDTINMKIHKDDVQFEDYQLTFLSNLKFYIKMINKNFLDMKEHVVNINKEPMVDKPKLITMIIINIINIFSNMIYCKKELEFCIFIANEMLELTNNSLRDWRVGVYKYAFDYLLEAIVNMKSTFEKISGLLDSLYTDLVKFQSNSLTKIIGTLNNISAYQQANLYLNNDFVTIDNVDINKIFKNSFGKLTVLPSNLNSFLEKYGVITDRDKLKRELFSTFIPVINTKNYNVLYNDDNKLVPAKCGYLINTPFYNNPKWQHIKIDLSGLEINECTEDDPLVTSGQISKYDDTKIGQDSLMGKITTTFDGSPPSPSIGPILDKYLYSLKYLIIQNLILVYYNDGLSQDQTQVINTNMVPQGDRPIIDAKVALPEDQKTVLANEFNVPLEFQLGGAQSINYNGTTGPDITINGDIINISNSIKQEIQNNTGIELGNEINLDTIFLSIVARLSDELLITYMKRSIYKSANKILRSYVRNMNEFTNMDLGYKEILSNSKVNLPLSLIDEGFSVNFRDLYKEITGEFINSTNYNDNQYNTLKYTNQIMKELDHDYDNYQHEMFNQDYTQKSLDLEKECYNANPKIIDYLVDAKSRANINHQDFVRSTPLFYAIDSLNPFIIKKLLDRGAITNSDKVRNLAGFTPYEYAINNLKMHNNMMFAKNDNNNYQLKNLYSSFNKTIEKAILDNENYANNIIKYMDDILPQTLMIYNHYLSNMITSYTGGYTYQDLLDLSKLIPDSTFMDREFPPLNLTDDEFKNLDIKGSQNSSVLNAELNDYSSDILDKRQKIEEYESQLINLQREASNTSNENLKKTLQDKINDIDNKIDELQGDIDPNRNGKQNLLTNLNYYTDYNVLDVQNRFNDDKGELLTLVDNTKNITAYYDKVVEIVFDDYMMYNTLFDKYINDKSKHNNRTNIYPTVINYINSMDTKNLNPNAIKILDKLHSTVLLRIAQDYEELPQKYDRRENYVLREVVDIITNVSGNIIGSNMYLAILKTITKYVIELNPADITTIKSKLLNKYGDMSDYNNFIKGTVKATIDFNNNTLINKPIPQNASLEKYIIKSLPKIYVKHVLKIFEGDEGADPHSQIGSTDRLFEPIIDILKSQTIIPANEQSSLIKNIRTYLIPYYTNLFNEFIPIMKVTIDNYNRFIINQGKYINVIQILTI